MNTLLLLALLLGPATPFGKVFDNMVLDSTVLDSTVLNSTVLGASMIDDSITDTSAEQPTILPLCSPPPVGDWVIAGNCLMLGDQVAPRDVLVVGGATLQLATGASLDIDLVNRKLEIDASSRVIIGVGARIH